MFECIPYLFNQIFACYFVELKFMQMENKLSRNGPFRERSFYRDFTVMYVNSIYYLIDQFCTSLHDLYELDSVAWLFEKKTSFWCVCVQCAFANNSFWFLILFKIISLIGFFARKYNLDFIYLNKRKSQCGWELLLLSNIPTAKRRFRRVKCKPMNGDDFVGKLRNK